MHHPHADNQIWPELAIGQRVAGTYHGVAYSGTVVRERHHSINWAVREVAVALESPIVVFDTCRDSVLVSFCGACGEPIHGFGPASLHA